MSAERRIRAEVRRRRSVRSGRSSGFRTLAMNSAEFYKRIAGILFPEKLRDRRVMVIGLGSGGCRVATELGRVGVPLILVDRPGELLLEHNIIRHALGYGSLGKPKVAEMAAHIRNLNPGVSVDTRALDVVDDLEAFQKQLEHMHPNVIAVCTDTEESKHAIDTAALRLKIPQVGAGVYDGGIGGEVYVVRPDQACYGCIAAHLQLQRQTKRRGVHIDYNHLDGDELRSTCALNLDIEQIALLQSRFVLHLLLEGDPDLIGLPPSVNLCVFSNRVVPSFFARPWHGEFYSVPRAPDCLDCGTLAGNIEAEAARIVGSLRGNGG